MPKIVPVGWRTLEAVILRAGFEFRRQQGSHRAYVKAGVARPVVIPTYAEVPVFLDSKASRLIQLADLVAYALFRHHEHNDNRFYLQLMFG